MDHPQPSQQKNTLKKTQKQVQWADKTTNHETVTAVGMTKPATMPKINLVDSDSEV